jgi:hypothetical protein
MLFNLRVCRVATVIGCITVATLCASRSRAAITWDSQLMSTATPPVAQGSGTQWWFDPANWSAETPASMAQSAPYYLPPNNAAGAITDTQINAGTATLPGGEGVVYDPINDPNIAAFNANPTNYPFPAGFGAQKIRDLYIGRAQTDLNPLPDNLLTIKGDLEMTTTLAVGRSSGVDGTAVNGRVNQLKGTVIIPNGNLDLGASDTSNAGIGNGTYDYRGGILNVQDISRSGGIRLSNGSNTVNNVTAEPTGASGIARFIVHNPAPGTGGFVRTYDMIFAAYAGVSDSATTNRDPDGVTRGVAIAEFHFDNGGVRPIQVGRNLSINNGAGQATVGGSRSARLELKLDSAPSAPGGVPINLGLFDVDFAQDDFDVATQLPLIGAITGTGDLDGDGVFNDDRVFSDASGTVHYREGDTVSAMFGSTKYNWTISYTGNITWSDANTSAISSITGATTGLDVVLMGLSVESVGLPGDFNLSGTVDAADYTVWRDNLGNPSDAALNGNGDGAAGVGPGDYDLWKNSFGTGSGSGSFATAVPEPSTLLMLLVNCCGVAGLRRRAQ